MCFDYGYSNKENLKAVRTHGWHFLTPVRSNRRVNLDRTGNQSISVSIPAEPNDTSLDLLSIRVRHQTVAPHGIRQQDRDQRIPLSPLVTVHGVKCLKSKRFTA